MACCLRHWGVLGMALVQSWFTRVSPDNKKYSYLPGSCHWSKSENTEFGGPMVYPYMRQFYVSMVDPILIKHCLQCAPVPSQTLLHPVGLETMQGWKDMKNISYPTSYPKCPKVRRGKTGQGWVEDGQIKSIKGAGSAAVGAAKSESPS